MKEILGDVREHPADLRPAFLREACGDDGDLRREVESLLSAEREAGEFLSRPALEPVASDMSGRRIGPYRVLGEVARGGMGAVYRAVRDDDTFSKTVALKLVRGALESPEIGRRFLQERRILARLQHVNIAAVLDGGTTGDGQPYLVMEFVEGRPITEYCRQTALSVRARVAMFRQVCEAVQYAHQNLVVHRDLKPDNILVTVDGTPKLLDFGIAKILAAGVDPDAAPTATLLPMMTPDYASPEQVKGEPITTASDVYSLGVLLYELLSGRRPYAVKVDSMEEIVRSVCQTEPPPPSAAGGARELTGDLDTIIMKALRKDPRRRYASAQEMAEDLRRYLEGLPVRARPDTLRYRTMKFVARHRGAVAAAAAIAIALVGGMTAAARQARIAGRERLRSERRFQEVRRLSNALIFELHDKISALPGATEARRLLVRRAAEYLDLLAQDAPDDAVLAEELATAHERLGEILGSSDYGNTGDVAGALAHHQAAVAIRERLAAERPDDLERQRKLSRSLERMAYADTGLGPGLAAARRAVEIAERLVTVQPARAEFQDAAAAAHLVLGVGLVEAADPAGALAEYGAAAAAYDREIALSPGKDNLRRSRALCDKRIGGVLIRSGRLAEAAALYARVREGERARVASNPAAVVARRDLSVTCVQLAGCHSELGDPGQALADIDEALLIREDLLREDPANTVAVVDLVSAREQRGEILLHQGKVQESLRALNAAASLVDRIPRSQDRLTISVFATRADAAARAGDRAASLADRRRAWDCSVRLLARDPTPRRTTEHARLALALGDDLAASGRSQEAHSIYTSALEQVLDLERTGKLAGHDAALPAEFGERLARRTSKSVSASVSR